MIVIANIKCNNCNKDMQGYRYGTEFIYIEECSLCTVRKNEEIKRLRKKINDMENSSFQLGFEAGRKNAISNNTIDAGLHDTKEDQL